MKKFFGKKQLLLGTLVVALGMAVYLNYYFAQSPLGLLDSGKQPQHNDKNLGDALNVNAQTGKEDPADTPTAADYFKQARENRERSREEATQTVKDLLNNVKATEEQKNAVTAQVLAITKAIDQESKIENLIKAKGFADCVVYIEDTKCSVVVSAPSLTVQDTAKISQVVTAQSDIAAQNINIVTVNS